MKFRIVQAPLVFTWTTVFVVLVDISLMHCKKSPPFQRTPSKRLEMTNEQRTQGAKSNSHLYQDSRAQNGTKKDVFGAGGISSSALFNDAVLKAHNEYRQMHHSPHLELDQTLTRQAQQYAKELSVRGLALVRHSPGYNAEKYGENIFVACGSHVFPIDPVKTWYYQVCKYDFFTHMPKINGANVKDFIQTVWRQTTKLGVGRAIGLHNGKPCTYIVAQYLPKGNGHEQRNNVDIGDFNKEICKDSNYVGFGARG